MTNLTPWMRQLTLARDITTARTTLPIGSTHLGEPDPDGGDHWMLHLRTPRGRSYTHRVDFADVKYAKKELLKSARECRNAFDEYWHGRNALYLPDRRARAYVATQCGASDQQMQKWFKGFADLPAGPPGTYGPDQPRPATLHTLRQPSATAAHRTHSRERKAAA